MLSVYVELRSIEVVNIPNARERDFEEMKNVSDLWRENFKASNGERSKKINLLRGWRELDGTKTVFERSKLTVTRCYYDECAEEAATIERALSYNIWNLIVQLEVSRRNLYRLLR